VEEDAEKDEERVEVELELEMSLDEVEGAGSASVGQTGKRDGKGPFEEFEQDVILDVARAVT